MVSFEAENVEEKLDKLMATVKKFRSMMADLNIPSNAKPTIFIHA